MSDGDLKIPAFSMGQAMAMLADVVAAYVAQTRPGDREFSEDEIKVFHQTEIAVFLYQLLSRAKHKEQMAGILDALAADLRDSDKPEQATPPPPDTDWRRG